MNNVVIFSGGLDSTVLLRDLVHGGQDNPLAIAFDYGQRHKKELAAAERICALERVPLTVVDIRDVANLMGATSLLAGNKGALKGTSTVVPNRNMIFIAIAAAKAMSMDPGQACAVYYGAHLSSAGIYPDTRTSFVDAMDIAIREGTGGVVKLVAPYVRMPKKDVVMRGAKVGALMDQSWSCYAGGKHHCGECYACTDRQASFLGAGIPDPTRYANRQPERGWRKWFGG